MSKLLLFFTIVQMLVCTVFGNAPFDFDRTCTHPTNFRIVPPTVPDNACVLMDSRYYSALLGSGGVWRAFERDPNGGTWVHGRGGLCTWQVRSCTNTRQRPQENYLISQYIHTAGVNEVWVELAYRFTSGGYTRAFDVLYFEASSPNSQMSVDPSNYKVLSEFVPTLTNGRITFSFDTTVKNGVYIAIRENGTCLTLSDMRVFTYCCKDRKVGLLSYPLTNAPSRNNRVPSVAEGQCVADSSVNNGANTTIDVSCLNFGRWDSGKDCVCDPGFIRDNNEEDSNCIVCSKNTYKTTYSNEDGCAMCPTNSVSNEGSSCCECKEGFYRTKDETCDHACTAPPSKPVNVAVTKSGSDSITIAWDPPVNSGGRTDVSYSVEYQSAATLFRGFIPAGGVDGSQHTFTVEGLKPVTEYIIRVTAGNGVSDQDPESSESRTCMISGTTTEGVPGKIDVFKNTRGSTYTWQPPTETNGEITGFVCWIFREEKLDERNVVALGPFEFCFSPKASMIPSGTGSVWVQVAAKTAVGVGEMSDPLLLQIEVQKQCSGLTDPVNGEVVVVSYLIGGSARYYCNNGYSLAGESERACQSDQIWSGTEPRCEPITCGTLRDPLNGRVSLRRGTGLTSIAEYSCGVGFQVTGDSLRFCQVDGTWTGQPPTCVTVPPVTVPATPPPATCPTCPTCPSCPTTPPTEACPVVTCPDCPTTPPSTPCPVVTCPTTTPSTPCPVVTCPTTPPPTPCPVVTCPTTPPSIPCPVVTCPTISPPTDCPVVPCPACPSPTNCLTADCPVNGISCGDVEPLTNGHAQKSGTSLGSVVNYSCQNGFSLTGSSQRECQAVGAWSSSAPSCAAVTCDELSPPDNGLVDYDGTSVNTLASYTCNTGYTLSGSNSRLCRFSGQWTGVQPTCIKDCEPLSEMIDNGDVLLTGHSLGSLAFFTCNTPYILEGGSSIRQCIHGEWTGEQPICKAPECENDGEVFSSCASVCRPTCGTPFPLCFAACRPGCMCPPGQVLDTEQSRCMNTEQCASFELKEEKYSNGSNIQLDDIGEGGDALIFNTDFDGCCQSQKIGECYDPDGELVQVRARGNEMYRNRGQQMLRLNRMSRVTGAQAKAGLYCCDVPISDKDYNRVCVDIVV